MSTRDHHAQIEGPLTVGLLFLVLLPALLLVYLGRKPAPGSAEAININTATAAQVASALGVSRSVGEQLVAYRDKRGGFESVEQLLFARAPQVAGATTAPALLLDPIASRPLLRQFVTRTPGSVQRMFLLCAFALILLAFLTPVLLRNSLRVSGDPFLIPLAMLLSGLGVVMLFSAKDPLRDRPFYLHHLSGIVFSTLVMLLCARLAPAARQRIRNYQYVWALAAALLVALLFLFGRGPEGVKLNLLGFQPVEAIKLFLVFFLASYLADRAGLIADASRPHTPKRLEGVRRSNGRPTFALLLPRYTDIAPLVVMFAGALAMFFILKDLGPGLLMFATCIAMLTLTTGRGSFTLIGLLLIVAGGCLGYWRHVGVFATRVDMWLHPFANAHPNGMQLGQAYWALASGGWEGSGLGLGMPHLIPRGTDDLAFIGWAEEVGLIGAWLTLVLYVALVWRGIRIALRARTDFDRALAFGLTALLGLQTLLILCGVTGLLPLTGIALPFLSYGDSALVAAFVIIGLLRGISASSKRNEATVVKPEIARAARGFVIAFVVALLGIVGIYRLGTTQLLFADEIASRAVRTPDADKVVRPHLNPRLLALAEGIERGSIYDRQGRILATSRSAEIRKLEPDPDTAARLIAAHTRLYPYRDAFAHLVGYLDPGVGGPSGFERGFNEPLRGYKTLRELLINYRNQNWFGYDPPRGRDLHLTLDANLQRTAQETLLRTVRHLKDKRTGKPKDRAAFVLLDPQTGDVLAAATIPAFDPNTLKPERYHQFVSGPEAQSEHRLINRAVNGFYPPGSTLKVATTAAALDSLPDPLHIAYDCNRIADVTWTTAKGQHAIRRNIRDDKGDPAFGRLSLPRAFEVSSNIYFANLATAIGSHTLRGELVDGLHFRFAPEPSAFEADLPDIGYGQGRMLASPLEMARLAATIANDGKMMKPRFLASLTDPMKREKDVTFASESLPNGRTKGNAITTHAARTLQTLMRGVVLRGTARGVFDSLPFGVAGKTGTAQNRQQDNEPHSWFIGFAPAGLSSIPPRYAFACVVENGGYGKTVAAAICRDVLHKLP